MLCWLHQIDAILFTEQLADGTSNIKIVLEQSVCLVLYCAYCAIFQHYKAFPLQQ